MKFSGKMRFITILKVRNSSVSPSLHKKTFLEKLTEGVKLIPQPF